MKVLNGIMVAGVLVFALALVAEIAMFVIVL